MNVIRDRPKKTKLLLASLGKSTIKEQMNDIFLYHCITHHTRITTIDVEISSPEHVSCVQSINK